jgi:hypothetical protein
MGATRGSLTHPDSQLGGDFSPFSYGAGGGVDLGLDRWLAVRGQVDWLHIGSTISNGQGSSVATWLVFRLDWCFASESQVVVSRLTIALQPGVVVAISP